MTVYAVNIDPKDLPVFVNAENPEAAIAEFENICGAVPRGLKAIVRKATIDELEEGAVG